MSKVKNRPSLSHELSPDKVKQIACEAYLYAYPLVLMNATREQMTNHVETQPSGLGGPANRFNHASGVPDASFHEVIRANVDTLYSSAWLDLDAEPYVF